MARPIKRAKIDSSAVHGVLTNHKEAILEAISTLSNRFLVFLRVVSCNADSPCSFTNAWCKTERCDKVVRFTDLYDVEVLSQLLDTGSIEDVDEYRKHGLQLAIQTLANFLDMPKGYLELKDSFQRCNRIPLKENEWTGLFGTHIAKELSRCKVVKISDAYEKTTVCVCGCLQELTYGDTSMGSKHGWHGSVDILLGRVALDVNLLLDKEDEEETTASIERRNEKLEKHRHQLTAKAVVFGCIQHELTPTIAVSKENFKVYMFDYQSDILLESEEFDLESPLGIDTVLALWLVINHDLLGLGLTPSIKTGGVQSEFKDFLFDKNKEEIYENDVHLTGCKKVNTLMPPLSKVLNQKRKEKCLGAMIQW